MRLRWHPDGFLLDVGSAASASDIAATSCPVSAVGNHVNPGSHQMLHGRHLHAILGR